MPCILNLAQAIALVAKRLEGLPQSVGQDDQKALRKITHQWIKGVDEIEGGGLTLESCQKMAALFIASENDSKAKILEDGNKQDLNMFEGLKRIHEIMALISAQQGINEGGKDCCPFCGGC